MCSGVGRPNPRRRLYGMKDEACPPFGRIPSLADKITRFLKSSIRVSMSPMICIPSSGSPEKGMDTPCRILCMIWRYNLLSGTICSSWNVFFMPCIVVKIENRNSFSIDTPSCPSGCMETMSCFKICNR